MNLTELLMERLADRQCSRCGRRLTDPDSIDRGMGPICAQHDFGTLKYGLVFLGHHPEDVKTDDVCEKFFNEFPNADFVVIPTWHSAYSAYANLEGFPYVFKGGEYYDEDSHPEGELDLEVENWRQNVIEKGLRFECIHTDALWMAIVNQRDYLGPTTKGLDEWYEENKEHYYKPELCSCMCDSIDLHLSDQEDDFRDTYGYNNELSELLLEKELQRLERYMWTVDYWQDQDYINPLFECTFTLDETDLV